MTETAAAFERHLLDNLDDVAGWSAYADYLTEQGDPRGDFMRVQLALEDETLDKAARKALQQEEEALRVGHLDLWLGDWVAAEHFDSKGKPKKGSHNMCVFRRGWLWEAKVGFEDNYGWDVSTFAAWRWLHTLDVDYCEPSLAGTPLTRNLRALRLGNDEYTSTGGYVQDMAALVTLVAHQLEVLYSCCRGMETTELFALPLVNLHTLQVHCQEAYAVQILSDNPAFAALRTLAFHPHGYNDWESNEEGAYLNANDVRLICGSPHLAGLEHLQLNCVAGGDDAVTALIESGRILTLKSLDLTHGSVTDDGAHWLAAALTAIPHRLDRLVLKDNALSADGVAALSAVPSLDFDAGEQHTPGDTDYLGQGDSE